MNRVIRHGLGLAMMVSFAGALPASAQQTSAVTLAAAGTFAKGGEFNGTVTINRFEQRGDQIVAIGFVSGVLSRGSKAIGSAVAGEVTWPVRVTAGGVAVASNRAPASVSPMRATWSPAMWPGASLLRVQDVCPLVNVALGPVSVNLLGVEVALGPVTFDVQALEGTPLGDLVCAVLDLVGNIAGLVNVLNAILGLLTGLLGGLGGLAGGAGAVV